MVLFSKEGASDNFLSPNRRCPNNEDNDLQNGMNPPDGNEIILQEESDDSLSSDEMDPPPQYNGMPPSPILGVVHVIEPGDAGEYVQDDSDIDDLEEEEDPLFNGGSPNIVRPDNDVEGGETQRLRYQLPGYVVQCEVQPEGHVAPTYHQLLLHSPEILLETNGANMNAFVAPNEQQPQQQNVAANEVGILTEGNTVRNRAYMYLGPPPNQQNVPGPSASLVIYHEQIIFAPPNIRFGPITRMTSDQFIPPQEEAPETPSGAQDILTPDQFIPPQEEAPETPSGAIDIDIEIEIDVEPVRNPTEREAIQVSDVSTGYGELVEENIYIEICDDSEAGSSVSAIDNKESENDRSDGSQNVGLEQEEASPAVSGLRDDGGNIQVPIPQVLRNGGMWVLPPGLRSPIRISGGPEKLAQWVISHAGMNYGLVREMKPSNVPQSAIEENPYLGFWPMEFEVEPFTELEQQLGVNVPQASRSDGGNSATWCKDDCGNSATCREDDAGNSATSREDEEGNSATCREDNRENSATPHEEDGGNSATCHQGDGEQNATCRKDGGGSEESSD